MVDRAVPEHLEVLGPVPGRGGRVVEGVGEADAVDRRLGHSPDRGGWLGTQYVQDGRDHVDEVRVLAADLTACLDALRPVHHERVAGAAPVTPLTMIVLCTLQRSQIVTGVELVNDGPGGLPGV